MEPSVPTEDLVFRGTKEGHESTHTQCRPRKPIELIEQGLLSNAKVFLLFVVSPVAS